MTVIRAVLLAAILFGLWLLLSGIYNGFFITLGAVWSVIVAIIIVKSGLLDEESLPLSMIPRGLVFWSWLGLEIVKSAINVTKIILHPKLPISPTLISFKPSQKTDMGLIIHANSITLTPGTVALGVSARENIIQVHGITNDGARDVVDSEMDAKTSWMEGQA